MTVLFCDLVGSTAIAAQLDPEEWRETVAGYHRAAAEAIMHFDGHVAKYLGDGVMAYFGWPARRARQRRRRLLATLVSWVLTSNRARPLTIATEDLPG